MAGAIMQYMPGLQEENKIQLQRKGKKTLKKLVRLYLQTIHQQHKQFRKDMAKSARQAVVAQPANADRQYCRKAQ